MDMMLLKKLNVLSKNKSLGFDLVRLYLGMGLFFRGLIFLVQPELINSYMSTFPYESLFFVVIHYVAFAHLAGGLLLLFGLLTRISALVQIPALFGAVFLVNLEKGLMTNDSLELSIMVLFLLILFAFFGSGKLSVDAYLESHSFEED
ncbi:DoxX family protein [Candidatus Marinamargulisbacteria bacterium SCGC AG-343-D04]|nr:DoxX family protein [Candidatus Marinamargulisbacteria bacterium SCGC AG-343-D04]